MSRCISLIIEHGDFPASHVRFQECIPHYPPTPGNSQDGAIQNDASKKNMAILCIMLNVFKACHGNPCFLHFFRVISPIFRGVKPSFFLLALGVQGCLVCMFVPFVKTCVSSISQPTDPVEAAGAQFTG